MPTAPEDVRRHGGIGAYVLPVLIMVAAAAAYLVPRPVTEWFGMEPTPPQVADDMDNIIRLIAVPVGFLGLMLVVFVSVVRSGKARRAAGEGKAASLTAA
jgi:hypothetical protein